MLWLPNDKRHVCTRCLASYGKTSAPARSGKKCAKCGHSMHSHGRVINTPYIKCNALKERTPAGSDPPSFKRCACVIKTRASTQRGRA